MTTKEKILYAALEMFSQKGYDGVSVREIARAVGVRESALYKHYKNKEDILLTIADVMKDRIAEAYQTFQVPEAVSADVVGGYQSMTNEEVCDLSWKLFEVFAKDPVNSSFRRLLTREQYNNKMIASLYERFFLGGVIESQSRTFLHLISGEMFQAEDPKIIALQFYGPILLLFQQYDCAPDMEEMIKKLLYDHVRAFGKHYVR